MAKKKKASGSKRGIKPAPRETQASLPPPFPLAMIVCDNIHFDPGSGKPFILGCFSVIGSGTLPIVHGVMGLYVELTNGRGKVDIKARLVDADEERSPVWEGSQSAEFEDPRMIFQLGFLLVNTTFEHAGEYRFQLFAGNEFLMERRILVVVHEAPK